MKARYLSKIRRWFKKHPSYCWKIPGAIALLIIASCSLKINTVDQPTSVNGGDVLNVKLHCTIAVDLGQTSKFMVAILVPKLWHAATNTNITFTSDITTGDQQMTLIPAGTPAPNGNGLDWPTLLTNKVGDGQNKLNEWEWVAFYSNQAYAVPGKTFNVDVTLAIKTSHDNLQFKPGYCIAESTDGLNDGQYYGSFFPNFCFQVNGDGDLIDFCNAQLASVDPRTSLDNDIVTVNFDAGLQTTDLHNPSEVYFCVKGYLTNGDSITVCNPSPETKMEGIGLNRWRKDIWPRGFFKLADNQHLARLSYYFTDVTGTIKVGYGGGADPFTYTFKCQ